MTCDIWPGRYLVVTGPKMIPGKSVAILGMSVQVAYI
jgi:hypothetical protein